MSNDKTRMKEADLCEEFMTFANEQGWTCYPESCGFDIFLERNGVQIGVEAKLKMNLKVVSQAVGRLVPEDRGCNPHFRTVLVPFDQPRYPEVLSRLKVWTFQSMNPAWYKKSAGRGCVLLESKDPVYEYQNWVWAAKNRCSVPEYVPLVPAGVSGPVQLTPFKINMMKLFFIMMHYNGGNMRRPGFRSTNLSNRCYFE